MNSRLLLMGTPRAEVDGNQVELPAKALALLGFLALADEPQPRDRILGLLWAESSEEAARKNLRNALWSVRKSLGEDAIIATGDRLALGAAVTSDVHELADLAVHLPDVAGKVPAATTDLDAALMLYRGAYLDGLALSDSPEFDIWLMSAQENLARSVLRLAEAAIDSHRLAGDWHGMASTARYALSLDGLHEPFHRALMEAHARLGERSEALRQYESARRALARDLDVEPLAETQALWAAIVAGELDPHVTVTPARGRTRRGLPEAEATPFVGRTEQLSAMDEELAAASAGRARVAMITGELGIGKSRVWRQWARARGAEGTVLEALCLEATRSLPYAPLVNLFADHPRIRPLLLAGSPVGRIWLSEVARLLPQVRAGSPDLPPPAALPLEVERHRVFEALVQVLFALNAQPLLLFFDDVQWADSTTLDWLAYLIHRMADRPLQITLAYRPDEAPPALVHQVATWARQGVVRRIPLSRLSPDETASLVAALHAGPGDSHRLQAQSGGNPYFLIELSKSDSGMPTPPALADLLRSRTERLSEPARQALTAASVLEGGFDLGLLQHVAAQSEDETLDALDDLLASHLLIEAGTSYSFSQPLVAEVVRSGLSNARRTVLTRRAVQGIEAAHHDRLGPVAGRLAGYHTALGEAETAATYLDLAAQHALFVAAPREAAHFLQEAQRLAPSLARRLSLARLAFETGDLDSARRAFEQVLAEAEASGDYRAAAGAAIGLGDSYLPLGRPDEVVKWAKRSLDQLEKVSDDAAYAYAHFLFGAGRLRAGGPAMAEAEEHLAEAARLADEHRLQGVAASSRFELGNIAAERGDLHTAVAAYDQSIRIAAIGGLTNQQVYGHNNAAYHLMLLGDLAAAHEHMDAAFALADTYDLQIPRQYLYSTRGEIAMAEGAWDDAENWFRRSMAEAERLNNREHIAKCQANLALAARGRGDLDLALILMEQATATAASLTARYMQSQFDLWIAGIYIERGERGAARSVLDRVEAQLVDGQYARLSAEAAALRPRLAQAN